MQALTCLAWTITDQLNKPQWTNPGKICAPCCVPSRHEQNLSQMHWDRSCLMHQRLPSFIYTLLLPPPPISTSAPYVLLAHLYHFGRDTGVCKLRCPNLRTVSSPAAVDLLNQTCPSCRCSHVLVPLPHSVILSLYLNIFGTTILRHLAVLYSYFLFLSLLRVCCLLCEIHCEQGISLHPDAFANKFL